MNKNKALVFLYSRRTDFLIFYVTLFCGSVAYIVKKHNGALIRNWFSNQTCNVALSEGCGFVIDSHPPISMTKEQEVLLMASMSQVWVSELHKEVNVMLRGITTHLRAHCTYFYPCLPTPGKLKNRVPRLFIKYKLNNSSLSKIISLTCSIV